MKTMVALVAVLFLTNLSVNAEAQMLQLSCSVNIQNKNLVATYTADLARMDLTDFEDGTQGGESFDGHLILSLDGKIIYDGPAEGTNEEYGVIIDHGRMTYVSLDAPIKDPLLSRN